MLLSDGRGGLPLDVLFEDVDPDEFATVAGLALDVTEGPYSCLLVRAPDGLLLVDSGLGAASHPFGGSGGELWSELERAGVAADDVDVVVVSHGHLDHIGGLTRDGAPAFTRARYVISEGEWSYGAWALGERNSRTASACVQNGHAIHSKEGDASMTVKRPEASPPASERASGPGSA